MVTDFAFRVLNDTCNCVFSEQDTEFKNWRMSKQPICSKHSGCLNSFLLHSVCRKILSGCENWYFYQSKSRTILMRVPVRSHFSAVSVDSPVLTIRGDAESLLFAGKCCAAPSKVTNKNNSLVPRLFLLIPR